MQLQRSMLEGLKNYWNELKAGTPGKRFQEQYKKSHAKSGGSPLRKVLFLGGGALVLAAGIFFLPAPGPGWAIIFIGGGLIAQESERGAKILDWTELRLRALVQWALRVWKHASAPMRAVIVLISAAVIGVVLYGAYLLLFNK